jgi:hypothetical protein
MPKLNFNTTGPCVSGEHYMLDPLRGIDRELMELVDGKQYFVIHAARQSGKTTLLWNLADRINARGDYYALYCSLEVVSAFTEPEKGIPEIVKNLERCIRNQGLPGRFAENADYSYVSGVLISTLVDYCRSLDKPLVILFDEADCLSNGTLITFLRQLRDGYISRSRVPFVHSIALVGMRNIRDYRAHIRPDSETLGSASPFNIVAKTFHLRNFTKTEVAGLYAQHTAETGQQFDPQAVDYAFDQTQGQPWLVNAVARECVDEIMQKDYSKLITPDLTEQAVRDIILKRGMHFDSLMERLKEDRVCKVIEQLITGGRTDKDSDDYLYVRDLGLIRENDRITEPANPIYAELIIRTLSRSVQESIEQTHQNYTIPRYLKDGKIDVDFLIGDFQKYWRENSGIWEECYAAESYKYPEAAPHLVMHAFLRRVVNGGGDVVREMALEKTRADLCIVYNGQKYPIELKILQNEKKRSESLNQILSYMDKCGSDTGWLVIFDRDKEKLWGEKIYMKEESVNGKKIVVAGC